jgi:glycogen operon protein
MQRVFDDCCVDEWCSPEGSPSPLGVTWIEEAEAFNFALYSKFATDVTLLLYSSNEYFQPLHEYRFNPLINKSERLAQSERSSAN